MVNPPLLLHEVLECIKGGGRKKRIPASPNPWLQARARCVVMPNFVANSMNISRRSKKLYPSATDRQLQSESVSTCSIHLHCVDTLADCSCGCGLVDLLWSACGAVVVSGCCVWLLNSLNNCEAQLHTSCLTTTNQSVYGNLRLSIMLSSGIVVIFHKHLRYW